MDRQCGQRVENNAATAPTITLSIGFRRATAGWTGVRSHGTTKEMRLVVAPCGIRAACLLSGLALFRRAHVRLGQPDAFLCARNLPFVPLLDSFVHRYP